MKVDKELLKGNTTMLILSLLSAADMYGYQMTKEIERRSNNTFTLREGTLYPILHSLEKNNMITSYLEDTDSPRKRKYYRITKDGQKLLTQKREEWAFFSATLNKVIGGELLV